MARTPVGSQTELELVKRCVHNDAAAERELFRREYRRVFGCLYRILGSERDTEDLVQETFVEVFRSLPSFRGESLLATWIDRIAVRVAYRHLRTRPAPSIQIELVPEPAGDADHAERQAHAREGVRRLYAALDELSPLTRLSLTLALIDGRTLEEVARLTGTSAVAARVRVWRARRALEKRAAADPVLAAYLAGGGASGREDNEP